jgi:hypothetical protein
MWIEQKQILLTFVVFVGFHSVRQQSYQVLPGDAFTSTCFYETSNGTTFGRASTQEMCEIFLFYYPAKTIFNRGQRSCGLGIPITACNATTEVARNALSNENTNESKESFQTYNFFERTFALSTSDQCEQKPSETIDSFKNTSRLVCAESCMHSIRICCYLVGSLFG